MDTIVFEYIRAYHFFKKVFNVSQIKIDVNNIMCEYKKIEIGEKKFEYSGDFVNNITIIYFKFPKMFEHIYKPKDKRRCILLFNKEAIKQGFVISDDHDFDKTLNNATSTAIIDARIRAYDELLNIVGGLQINMYKNIIIPDLNEVPSCHPVTGDDSLELYRIFSEKVIHHNKHPYICKLNHFRELTVLNLTAAYELLSDVLPDEYLMLYNKEHNAFYLSKKTF